MLVILIVYHALITIETLVYGEVTFSFMYAMLTDSRLELPNGGHFVDLGNYSQPKLFRV
jgi:hypothetical protein